MTGKHPELGLMTCRKAGDPPFQEAATCTDMSLAASRQGADLAVFYPEAVQNDGTVHPAYLLNRDGTWSARTVHLPPVVLERTFCSQAEEKTVLRQARTFLRQQGTIVLSGRVGGKLAVFRCLSLADGLKPHLPSTELFHPEGVARRLSEQGAVFLKPDGGSKGEGCIRILRSASEYLTAEGRDRQNQPFRKSFSQLRELFLWLSRFMKGRRYLIQDYLQLTGKKGSPFDLRALVQKDPRGRWSLTGIAVRQGERGGMTANLHGGGKALSAQEWLTEEFGSVRATQLLHQVERMAGQIPPLLEESFGRLVELGLDFGIEPDGRLWFLEANSRPGRASFRSIGDGEASSLSTSRPVSYALQLTRRMPPHTDRTAPIPLFRPDRVKQENGVSFRRIM